MLVNLKHVLAHKWQKNQIIFQDRFYFSDSPHPQGEEAGDPLSVKEYTDNGLGKVLKLNWIPKISQRTSSTIRAVRSYKNPRFWIYCCTESNQNLLYTCFEVNFHAVQFLQICYCCFSKYVAVVSKLKIDTELMP